MPDNFDIVIIGSGPGGYVAAIRAAQLGYNVACVEKEKNLGGTCLNIGCIPSKALLHSSKKFSESKKNFEEHGILIEKVNLDLKKMMQRKEKIVAQLTSGIQFLFKKNKITHINGEASFIDKNNILVKSENGEKKIQSKYIIIATGSKSANIPFVEIDEKNLITSTGALSLNQIPKTLLIVGGGYIGLEMGSVWSRLGSKVTVIEVLDQIVPLMDKEISIHFKKSLEKQGLNFNLNHKVLETKKNKNHVEVTIESIQNKKKIVENYDSILISVGRVPNIESLNLDKVGVKIEKNKSIITNKDYQTNVKNIFAIGDVIAGPMLAHKAEEEGIACVEKIAGQKPEINYDIIPSIIYTQPEIASVGKTEEQLKIEKIDYVIGKFPFSANGRALTTSETEGFVKILSDKKTDQILGAHIIGNEAGNLISEIVTAMEFGGSSEDIARICHAHPTMSEAVKEAALGIDKRSIHI